MAKDNGIARAIYVLALVVSGTGLAIVIAIGNIGG